MVRKVFYSFHYQNDITRAMAVRNRWVTFGNQVSSGIIDKADFETIQRQGESAIKRWIDKQLEGTSATIVLIGSETLKRPWVQYEIAKSLERGNAIIGVYVNKIKDFDGKTTTACRQNTMVKDEEGNMRPFDEITNDIYDYVDDNGYENLDFWVEMAVTCK